MRTHTSTTQRAAVVMSGAIAALVIGGATAPAAFAQPGGKDAANHGKKAGHSKASQAPRTGHAKKADRSQGSTASTDSNRASSNKDGSGHNDDWQAQSDPDGMENGGVDQPGGNGGYDPKGWDGNNGSGNDPDCEDDNRGKGVPGHCKDRPQRAQAEQAQAEQAKTTGNSASQPSADSGVAALPPALLEEGAFTVASAGGGTVVAETGAEVLGVEQFAGDAPAALAASADTAPVDAAERNLPDTGAEAAMLVMLAGGLAAAGTGAVMVRRNRATQS